MNRITLRAMALFSIIALAACSGGSMGRTLMPQQQNGAQTAAVPEANEFSLMRPLRGDIPFRTPNAVREMCPSAGLKPGEMRCYALMRTDLINVLNPDGCGSGYGPADLQSAYNLPNSGKGTTVAIVDAFGYKKAESDLGMYRKCFGLPPCTKANGCLKIINEHGKASPLPPDNLGWDGEQALDLAMVSATCPHCKIILVQANGNASSSGVRGVDLYTAVKSAALAGADVVSNSYGGAESEASDPFFISGPTYVASSGDGGGGKSWGTETGGAQQPCTLPNVLCVGGTKLEMATNTRGWTEVVWNDLKVTCSGGGPCGAANSGCSKLVAKPSWQNAGNPTCPKRAASDVSASAAVTAPVAVYLSGYGGWVTYGGTSASAPIIAGIIGLTGNGKSTNIAQLVWGKAGSSSLNDVTSGTNIYGPVTGKCASSVKYICTAGPGYDGPTGNGTPNGTGAL